MPSLVLDTHAAVWYLLKSEKLSIAAYTAIDQVADSEIVCISAVSLVEIIYLSEKGRINQTAVDRLLQVVLNPQTGWIVVPLDVEIAQAMAAIQRNAVPDMPDRIIAATALHLGLPLVTRDAKIRASGLTTIW